MVINEFSANYIKPFEVINSSAKCSFIVAEGTVIDGKITSVYTNGSVDLNSVTLHDIVCGSFIVVNFTNNVAPETSIGVEFLGGGASVWKIIANAGETAVLSFYSPF